MKFTAWQGLAGFFALQLGGCPFLFNTNVCGDGDVDAFEECDDANNSDADACSNQCTATFCGDGIVQPGFEECDDFNTINGDGCDAICVFEGGADCGDGIEDIGEGCDDGNNNNFDGCAGNCTVEQTGDVLFDYVLLGLDGNGLLVAGSSCNDPNLGTPISDVHFMLGDDFNGDAILDDSEIIQEAFLPCDQLDNPNTGTVGTLEPAEFGFFGETFFAGTFELFAVEYLDGAGSALPWQTFDANTDATRFSFSGGITVPINNAFVIPFVGNASQNQDELQSFFGF